MKNGSRREETRERIIAAAGVVFAERGYRGTTIRQITSRARVNLAAVNYHFRDKSELYVRVLLEAKRHVPLITVRDCSVTPEAQLLSFIESFVRHLLDPQRPTWHGRVLAMEMSNPTPALDLVVREVTAPFFLEVRDLVAELVRQTASAIELDLLTTSIFAQCVFYVSGRPVVEQLTVDLGRTPDRVERIARHIGLFSLAALKDFRRRAGQPRRVVSRRRTRQSLLS